MKNNFIKGMTDLLHEIDSALYFKDFDSDFGSRAIFSNYKLISTNTGYELHIEVPGYGPENVELYVEGILATVKTPSSERGYVIPKDVDLNKIEAFTKNGLLTIILPKIVDSNKQSRKIKVT